MKNLCLILLILSFTFNLALSQDTVSMNKLMDEKMIAVELITNLTISGIYSNLLLLDQVRNEITRNNDLIYQNKVLISLIESFHLIDQQLMRYSRDVILGNSDKTFVLRLRAIYSELHDLTVLLQEYISDKKESTLKKFEKNYKSAFNKYQDIFTQSN